MKTNINRRTFLRSGVFAGLAGLLASRRGEAYQISRYTNSMGVLVDISRCVGCRSCEAACNSEHKLPAPAEPFTSEDVFLEDEHSLQRRTDETRYTVVNRYNPADNSHPLYRKVQCNHCQEPACLTSCFVNAYTKTAEGAVIYNEKVCVGCRTCMIACPFYIPTFKYSSAFSPRIEKCNFCYDSRLTKGLPPACVEACPQDALYFGKRDELLRIGRSRITKDSSYQNHIYGEHEAGGTSWLYISKTPFQEIGFNMEVPHAPILDSVKNFLGFVPMVLTIWPALFAGFHLLATRKEKPVSASEMSHEEEKK